MSCVFGSSLTVIFLRLRILGKRSPVLLSSNAPGVPCMAVGTNLGCVCVRTTCITTRCPSFLSKNTLLIGGGHKIVNPFTGKWMQPALCFGSEKDQQLVTYHGLLSFTKTTWSAIIRNYGSCHAYLSIFYLRYPEMLTLITLISCSRSSSTNWYL